MKTPILQSAIAPVALLANTFPRVNDTPILGYQFKPGQYVSSALQTSEIFGDCEVEVSHSCVQLSSRYWHGSS